MVFSSPPSEFICLPTGWTPDLLHPLCPDVFWCVVLFLSSSDSSLFYFCHSFVIWCTAPILSATRFATFPIGFPWLPMSSLAGILSPLSWYPHLLPQDSNLFPYFPIPVPTFPTPFQQFLCLPAIPPPLARMSTDHTFPFRKSFHVINMCRIIEVSAYSVQWRPLLVWSLRSSSP